MSNHAILDMQAFNELLKPQHLPSQDLEILQSARQQSPRSQFLCYVVYGDNTIYYEGIKLSILSFFSQIQNNKRPAVVILSERPSFFEAWQKQADFDIINLTLTKTLYDIGTQDGYHYRLKTLGLAYIMRLLCEQNIATLESKFLFFDSDTYFLTNPLSLYDKIDKNHVVMYKQEPAIFAHKKYRNYVHGEADKAGVDGLLDKDIDYTHPTNGEKIIYRLQSDATMYSSLIMGVLPSAIPYLLQTCNLMYPVRKLTNARTVEQFCFAEVFKQHFTIVEGKDFVNHFSRRRQKAYVESQMANFWRQFDDIDFNNQLANIHTIKFQRPFWLTLAQAIKRIFKPEHIR